jgi:acyl-CoA synthetase (AMP-forming)/AMP-acid ligase II
MNAGVAVARQARVQPDALAVFDHQRRRTWRELHERSNRLAQALQSRFGVKPGDRVALLAPNRLEVVEVLCAVHKAGAVYVGLNFRMTDNDLDGALQNAGPRLLIGAGELAEEGTALALRHGISWLDLDDTSSDGYEAVLSSSSCGDPPMLHATPGSADAAIVYTSGTTGRPKGILFTHDAMIQHATVACIEYEISSASTYLIQIPHNSSVNITMVPCLVVGATIGFADNRSFDPERFAHIVESERVTHTFLVPTQLMRILDCEIDLSAMMSSLETLGYGSSPISPDRLRVLVARFGAIFIQLYGMAEIASIGTLLRKGDHLRGLTTSPELLRSAGRASIAVDVRVVDGEGNDVEVGERGEVIFGGPHLMKEYYRDPERTREVLVDGWIRSGDVAEVDEEGFVSIVDRIKNLIIRGGQNISPVDIENAFYRHEAVLEVAVVGAPDAEWGERIVAVVALRPGTGASSQELLAFVAADLPRFVCPEEIQFVQELPKNAVGKIDKQAVRRPMWSGGRQV